jgi:hypothetical protein
VPALGELLNHGVGFVDAEAAEGRGDRLVDELAQGQFEAGERGGGFGGIESPDLWGNVGGCAAPRFSYVHWNLSR